MLSLTLVVGCAWGPWIPGSRSWNPDIEMDPAKLSIRLALDSPYVDELSCLSRICDQRFRVVVEEPGQLTLRTVADRVSLDDQVRMVLESTQGVLGQASTLRGSREDVPPPLTIRRPVRPGTYFVLLQSIGGGRVPYEITASLTPGDVPAPPEAPSQTEAVEVATLKALDPPPRLIEVSPRVGSPGRYDPAVVYTPFQTFAFAPLARADENAPTSSRLETPVDRQIRRFLNDGLVQKGFQPATGTRQADFTVAFRRSQSTGIYRDLDAVYGRYELGQSIRGESVTRATITLDIVESRSGRIAWQASSTQKLGVADPTGAEQTAKVQRAVSELLQPFPPGR
ncbi:MAG: DUF4136 domain-containing protein [Myxococcota bacterium]|nr:DUF4136 domain-containing protein [Myxococcota bacterium]